MAVQLNDIDRERLQNSDKTDAIELYYKLLSSGHSVGEILNGLNSVQSKAGHDDAAAAIYARAKPDGTPTDIAPEGAPVEGAQANTRFVSGVSASQEADNGSTEAPLATESVQLNRRESDDGEQLRDRLSGSKPSIPEPLAAPTSTSCDTKLRRNDLDQVQPRRFPRTVRRIACWVIYTAAVASAAITGFSIVDGDRYIQSIIARVLLGISNGIEIAATPSATINSRKTVENRTKLKEQAVDVDLLRAAKPTEPVGEDPVVPGPAQRVAAEVRAMISAALSRANAAHELEAGRQLDATPVSASVAATPAAATLRKVSVIATMKADAARGIEPIQTHATEPAAGTISAPALMKALKSAPEPQDIASAVTAETEHRIEGDRGGARVTSPAKTARVEPPEVVRLPAHEAAAPTAALDIAEITPEKVPFQPAEANALVTRGDAFFAAGDLASARLFYEHAVAAGNGTAALRLGSTYDPDFLTHVHIGRVQGDATIALYWYRRGRDLGNRDAEVLLKGIENTAR